MDGGTSIVSPFVFQRDAKRDRLFLNIAALLIDRLVGKYARLLVTELAAPYWSPRVRAGPQSFAVYFYWPATGRRGQKQSPAGARFSTKQKGNTNFSWNLDPPFPDKDLRPPPLCGIVLSRLRSGAMPMSSLEQL